MDPAQLMLFLSAVTEPAMLLLLASPWYPINPLGAVNVRNRFELMQPDLCDLETLMKQNSASLSALVCSGARRVKRGFEYDLEVMINIPRTDGGIDTIFRQIFTMLESSKTPGHEGSRKPDTKRPIVAESRSANLIAQLSLSVNDPLK
ncbi:hypothetical protein EJ02DRAFT_474658 [Clathrospora elynae]|uniref:Uncharacterized protein n=1 Tax=Clathrospora elynae TaxID=706981 RepID=A0A6A5SEV7_9PLEO|nr:hypothetical protein EJ02DRAFT_474658 [Clathrospora elynae]